MGIVIMNKQIKTHCENFSYFAEMKYNDKWIAIECNSLEEAKELVSYLHFRDIVAREVIAKTSYNFL